MSRSKVCIAALCAMISVSAVAARAETVFSSFTGNTTRNFEGSATLGSLVSGSWYSLLVSWTRATDLPGFSSFGAVITGTNGSNTVTSASLLTSGDYGNGSYSLTSTFKALAGYSYSIEFGSANERVRNFNVQVATAVPGPIAGAGLPFLMALGAAALYRRRKQIAA